jgi:hypothetical protein
LYATNPCRLILSDKPKDISNQEQRSDESQRYRSAFEKSGKTSEVSERMIQMPGVSDG